MKLSEEKAEMERENGGKLWILFGSLRKISLRLEKTVKFVEWVEEDCK